MTRLALALVGGPRGVLVASGGFLAGVAAMWIAAHAVLIPAAERVAREQLRAKIAIGAAEGIAKAASEARTIERNTTDATDEALRCALHPRACGVH